MTPLKKIVMLGQLQGGIFMEHRVWDAPPPNRVRMIPAPIADDLAQSEMAVRVGEDELPDGLEDYLTRTGEAQYLTGDAPLAVNEASPHAELPGAHLTAGQTDRIEALEAQVAKLEALLKAG